MVSDLMSKDIITLLLGFFEGFVLILSPCILPILPIILAGSLTGSKRHPLGIISGFVILFSLVGFFSRQWVQYTGVDLNIVRDISYVFLTLLGITMLSAYLNERLSLLMQKMMRILPSVAHANNPQGGFISGFLFGGLVAIIWAPCAGPILAAVIVQTVMQQTNGFSFLILLAFGAGAGLPMLIIACYGRVLTQTFKVFKTKLIWFRQLLGAVILFSVGFSIYQENAQVITPLAQTSIRTSAALQEGLWRPYPAPSIEGITHWINSSPIVLSTLKGKVILIDFWTYSCINCLRTLPYVNTWYKKYHDKGLIVIGVHTPEFDFEKQRHNVDAAVKRNAVLYPVALDNQFITWENFHNQYWPAHYLIDKNGQVVYTHFGEGDYDITENNIRFLLGIREFEMPARITPTLAFREQTPETYVGYSRAKLKSELVPDKTVDYHFPKTLSVDDWALEGQWTVLSDRIVSAKAGAAIKIHFNATNVYMVMGNASSKSIKVGVALNGQPVKRDKGSDIINSQINVTQHSIYHILSLQVAHEGILEIKANAPGLEIYTFTFGMGLF